MKQAGNNQFISNFHIKIQNHKCIGNFTHHSMAKDNFNKSKETTPTTSAALMVAP